ncbi:MULTISPECIES: efflux RND transporter periplasmic adaptor subunit [Ramlibacter]|uniref:Efflux RND transporter periplasmic adaptor subunit n=1 Tax=Ramlibacter pinisoli TaxID=2682844 RepID=A0A6N8INF5_9BURK|nr:MULTISPECIES: efflux RND transporter periplasmic adaptor subunit [Ramlibacter]MBA2963432.1 efflux RND transporter periplasmic adaptor subunit [Ramlibacter sp. CGMCC 1.13660]MVQ28399.1 efflux RND transporter periplasmic adaptor subunit [Ramlibacter pinisoli]
MTTPTPARLAGLLLPWLVAAVLAGCSRPEPAPEPVRSVKVLTVGSGTFQSSHEYAGEVRPRIESRLGFRVAGKIVRRQAEVGQRVKPGQLLAQLDPQDYRLAADASRAQVAAALTNRDLAAADYKRYAVLRDQNFISGAELERRDTTLKAAQAQLEQAQAQLAAQSNQARYTDLVADVAGVVTAIEAEPGQVVAAGSAVVRIAQDGPRDVVFSVPEDKVAAIRPGSAVAVRAWASGGDFKGRVREVAASADPVTRTYAVKVGLDGAEQPPLGATATVVPEGLGLAGSAVIKLPTSALRQEGAATAVWVLDQPTMTVRSQPVQVTTADGNEAVIAGGLQPGMMVVSAGVHVLSPGQKVRIYEDKASAAVLGAAAQVPPAAVQPVVNK